MRLCECPTPVRRLDSHDRLRCHRCQGWTPHGRPLTRPRLERTTDDIASLTGRLADDLAWDLARRGDTARGAPGPSDPTQAAALDQRQRRVADWAALAGRMVERAREWLLLADQAAGEMLQAADPGPPEKTLGPWYPEVPSGRPDIVEAHRAKARRADRKEGFGVS